MKRDLWVRLKHYHFDDLVPPQLIDHVAAVFGGTDASTKAFANKLARKRGWSPVFALTAIEEYKKFVFLGVVSDFAVTPPKVIDQVWHEHILFSRAYREFCKRVVGRDFDHHPELIATEEQTGVFQAQFAATLALYETEFNYPAPIAIWGLPKFRSDTPLKSRTPPEKATRAAAADEDALHLLVGDSGSDSCHSDHSGGHESSFGGHDGGGDGGGGDGGASCGGGSGCSSGCGGGCSS